MNKLLRYSLVALLCAMFNVSFADDIKFDFDNDYATLFPGLAGTSSNESHDGDFTETTTSTAVSGATVTVSAKASGNNDNRIWNGSPRLRMYSGTFTVTAPEGKEITKITFDAHNSNFNLSTTNGTLNERTWTGSSSEVVFDVAKNTQIRSITLTVNGQGQPEEAKLTISGNSQFYGSTTVTISVNRDASSIYYTTDGSDPAGDNAIDYTEPFTITESCTVKAIDELSGATAEMAFEKLETATANNIAELLALDNDVVADLTLTNAVVLGHGNRNTVVKDASGSLLIYYIGKDLTQGQIINGTVQGKRTVYGGVDELSVGKDNIVDITITDGTVTPVEVTAAEIAGKDLLKEVYKLKDVTVKKNADNNRFYVMNGDNEAIQIYDEFKIANMIAEDGTYTIEGLRGKYAKDGNETPQLWITKVGAGDDPQPGEVVKVNNIAEFKALAENTEAELTLTNAKVVYKFVTNSASANTSIYMRDNSGAICFYNVAKDLNVNDDVNGTIIVKRTSFRALPQAQAIDGKTTADNLLAVAGAAAEPKVISVSEVADNLCDLVEVQNVKVTTDGADNPKFYATSGEDQVQIYNNFYVEGYDKDGLSAMVGDNLYNIKAIAITYNTTTEIAPIEEGIVSGINNVKTIDAANGAIYNVAGQRVDASYKGIVIKNGKKMIQK